MSGLPPGLGAWAPELSALTDELSVALGPWLTEITALLTEHDSALAEHGEPDGFDGLSARGTPHRLLVSEWLLAMEEPVEFLRRAAENELLHLAPAFRHSAPRARVAVLCDCGPAQWGPARLVQLAVLLVMHRRAATHGVTLALGVLGDEPGEWREGDLERLLKGWHGSRRLAAAEPGEVDGWVSTLNSGEEIWLLGGGDDGDDGDDGDGRGRTNVNQLRIGESGWDSTGVTTVTISLGGRKRVLSMPAHAQAVAALRGRGFRGEKRPARPGSLRFPVFPNASRTMLGRGDDDRTVVTVSVPDGRPRRHQFPGPVVAAGLHGKRLIVLTLADGMLRAHVSGRPLDAYQGARWPYPEPMGADGPPAPLLLAPDGLLTRLAGSWIRLHPNHSEPVDAKIDSAGYGEHPGQPRIISAAGPGETVFGRIPLHCSTWDGREWMVHAGDTLTLPEGDRIVGMTWLESKPALVSRSTGGQILHLVTAERTRTLTRWANGTTASAATHTTHPWLAVARFDGTVIVADLESGKQIFRLRGPS